jgi:hypothetical protein
MSEPISSRHNTAPGLGPDTLQQQQAARLPGPCMKHTQQSYHKAVCRSLNGVLALDGLQRLQHHMQKDSQDKNTARSTSTLMQCAAKPLTLWCA